MDPRIPTFMIVSGLLCCLFTFCVFWYSWLGEKRKTVGSAALTIGTLALLAIFAVQCWGSYLVFRKWSDCRTLGCHSSYSGPGRMEKCQREVLNQTISQG